MSRVNKALGAVNQKKVENHFSMTFNMDNIMT